MGTVHVFVLCLLYPMLVARGDQQRHSNATVVLIRTHNNFRKYLPLFARNAAIAQQSWHADCDHIIFHESLPEGHMAYITLRSRPLSLRFIDVQSTFTNGYTLMAHVLRFYKHYGTCPLMLDNKDGTYGYNTGVIDARVVGYRSMCWFWYSDFYRYVRTYHTILRIDDDCTLFNSSAAWLNMPSNFAIATVAYSRFVPSQTIVGMYEWFSGYARNHSYPPFLLQKLYINTGFQRNILQTVPLTSMLAINVRWVLGKSNQEKRTAPAATSSYSSRNASRDDAESPVLALMKAVAKTTCIYKARWGDVELWGATMTLFGLERMFLPHFAYVHGSHNFTYCSKKCMQRMNIEPEVSSLSYTSKNGDVLEGEWGAA